MNIYKRLKQCVLHNIAHVFIYLSLMGRNIMEIESKMLSSAYGFKNKKLAFSCF